jgi:hypothetical protein
LSFSFSRPPSAFGTITTPIPQRLVRFATLRTINRWSRRRFAPRSLGLLRFGLPFRLKRHPQISIRSRFTPLHAHRLPLKSLYSIRTQLNLLLRDQ